MKFLPVICLTSIAVAGALAQTRPVPKVSKPNLAPEPAVTAPAPAAAPTPTAADAPPGPVEGEAPEKTIARFFSYLQRKEVDQAYDQLTKGTKIADRAEDVKMLKSKTKDALAVFGVMTGFDPVAKKAVGERLISYTYVSLGKEFPLRWRFYFYKPQENWKLIDLRVDDRLSSMFDEPEPPSASREP
jgi:hypothetical protein